jgi:hypothetical protein
MKRIVYAFMVGLSSVVADALLSVFEFSYYYGRKYEEIRSGWLLKLSELEKEES